MLYVSLYLWGAYYTFGIFVKLSVYSPKSDYLSMYCSLFTFDKNENNLKYLGGVLTRMRSTWKRKKLGQERKLISCDSSEGEVNLF